MSPLMDHMFSQEAMVKLPMFHSLSHCIYASYDFSFVSELLKIENEIIQLAGRTKTEGHRYGANFGVNLSLLVVSGGTQFKGIEPWDESFFV
jgi:hypothetical protein